MPTVCTRTSQDQHLHQTRQPEQHPEQRSPKRRHHKTRRPPWKSPFSCVVLVASLLVSVWLTVNMPSQTPKVRPVSQTQSQTPGKMVTQMPGHRHSEAAGNMAAGAAAQHSTSMTKAHGSRAEERDAVSRLVRRAKTFARLFLFVGLGAMLGSIIEGRAWYRYFASSLGRLARAARMPFVVGIAMPTAFASAAAADSMLVASHQKGELGMSTLIAGGMLNSFFAYLSHSMRVMYPVVAAIGLPGLCYFLIQFSGAALVSLGVLAVHRLLFARRQAAGPAGAADPAHPADPAACGETALIPEPEAWNSVLRKGCVRALALLFRLACISIPLVLLLEWLIRSGALNFWDKLVPEVVSQFIPEQLLVILAAQLGGLVQSATVSAGLLAEHLITGPQVLLAMLISSAASNPVRTLRRNLPTALAIFPARAACTIVFGMQLFRFFFSLLAAALLIVWMHA